ncbi:MAG: condensation domain-containing protein, partial [Acidobacteria bacterium]|nr:condensation domain-containing protein [Acidobacteriota bacterium]
QQLEPTGIAYNIPLIIGLREDIQVEKLPGVFKQLIKRHDSLRTSFHMLHDVPIQKIDEEVQFEIKVFAELFSKSDPPEAIKSFIHPFDLSCAPLLRVGLVKNRDGSLILLIDMHHIITDGTSQEVLKHDFMSLYKGEPLPTLRLQYKDFAEWQNSNKEREKLKSQESYWLKEFAGEIPVLELPVDYPRPLMQSFAGNRFAFEITDEEKQALNERALQSGATLFMVLAAILNILLTKLSGREDIIIGVPVAARRHADLEKIIGMFVNTLALRNYPNGEKSFSGFLDELKDRTLAAFENQEYQFEDLVEKVVIHRDMGRNPLFDVLLVVQNVKKTPGEGFHGFETVEKEGEIIQVSKFDLEINAWETGEGINIVFGYCTQLFKQETIERFIIYFKKITSFIIQSPGIRIKDIEIISDEEKEQILHDFNQTETEYPKHKTIQQLFAEQVSRTPDHIALHGCMIAWMDDCMDAWMHGMHLSYRELNEQSDRLAWLLIEKGVLADNIVGLMIDRTIETIIGIIGILKSGGAYLPIDPDFPRERIDYMLKDSRAAILLTNLETKRMDNCQCSIVNCQLSMEKQLAYVIYTSGSTGKPKGVMVEHGNVVRFAISFDASTFEIWGALLNGPGLVILSKEILLNTVLLKRAMQVFNISIAWMTVSLFNQIVEEDEDVFMNLRNLLVGGDTLSPVHINRVRKRFPGLTIINGYGPTENTTFSTTFRIEREYLNNIPIGTPIANSTAYILDKYNHLSPVGVCGELHVGGDGVARGYLNNPELTAGKFGPLITLMPQMSLMKNKSFFGGLRGAVFSKKAPLVYNTGDFARWLVDGNIQFLGRSDQQVKIRGFRIELGEIENRLTKYPGIKQAVVLDLAEKQDKYLCAYVVSDKEYDLKVLQEYLAKELPDYMIPSYFLQLEKIPLTPNGKIDRKALQKPVLKAGENYMAPRNTLEKKLVELWSEILGPISPGIDDNFFQLGGHSLKATILVSKIHKILNVHVPLAEVFKHSTIRELAGYIKSKTAGEYESIQPVEKKEYYALSSAQKRLYFLQQLEPTGIAYNIPLIIGLREDIQVEKLPGVFK